MSWKNHYSKLVYWGSIIECIYAIRYPVTWWKWWSSGGWNVYVWKTASLLFSNLPLRFCMVLPRRPRGSQSGQVKRRDERFRTWTEEPLVTDISPDHFQTVKRMLVPDWAQKMLCISVPNRWTVSPEFFSWVRTWRLLSCDSCPVRSPSFPNQKWRKVTNESKNVSDAISRRNSLCTEKILFLTDHNVS